jgi:hypothetical protein
MDVKMTRRQFGIAVILGIASLIGWRLLGALRFLRPNARERAMHWRPGDGLAG